MFETRRPNTAPSLFSMLGGRGGLWRLLRPLLLGLVLVGVGVVCAPLWLLNTESGRFVIRAVANSSDDGHLSLRSSQLELLPAINLTLEGLRLARPFEPDAPRLRLERMLLEGLSKESHRPGQPLVCVRARFEGVEALLDQRWVDAQKGQAAPPQLPAAFPRRIEAEVVEVVDTSYRIRQTLRGRDTETRMEGVSLHLQHFQWDLAAMQVTGDGPLTAETLVMNGLTLRQLKIPQLRAEASRVVIPQALLEGLGGTLTFSGEVRFQEGVPTPDLELEGHGLQLSQVVSSGPGARQGQPTPEGTVFMRARVRGQPATRPGEAPEPVLEGSIQIQGLQLPVKQKSKLAKLIVERLPGYVEGVVPRLTLGDVAGHFRTANGFVTLYENQIQQGPLRMVMDGTIEQATGKLNLRLWLDRKTTQEALALLKKEKGLRGVFAGLPGPSLPPLSLPAISLPGVNLPAVNLPAPGVPLLRPPPMPGGVAQQLEQKGSAALATAPSTSEGTEAPSSSETSGDSTTSTSEVVARVSQGEALADAKRRLEERAGAARQALDARTAQLKAELETHAVRAKADFEARAAGLKAQLDERSVQAQAQVQAQVQAAQERVEQRLEAVKQQLEPGLVKAQAGLEAQRTALEGMVQEQKAGLDARLSQALGVLPPGLEQARELREGNPTLCITGTQAEPIIKLCAEE